MYGKGKSNSSVPSDSQREAGRPAGPRGPGAARAGVRGAGGRGR
uniref:Uncharacterized protein n=1 Tax=Falco tinnunculus TaxID=100819 RepID=A0A8C4UEM1_FALTI